MQRIKTLGEIYGPLKKIGQGGFGVVYKTTRKDNGQEVAIKVLFSNRIKSRSGDSAKEIESNLEKEFNLLQRLNPKCTKSTIVCYKKMYLRTNPRSYVLEMNLVPGSTVDKLRTLQLTNKELLKFAKSLLQTLVFIHSKGIAHRDIKPENVVCNTRGTCTVIDFGLYCTLSKYKPCNSPAGTPIYMHPHIIHNWNYLSNWKSVDFRKNDIYGVGVIMYELYTGNYFSFINLSNSDIDNAPLWLKYIFKNTIQQKDYKKIPTANTLLKAINKYTRPKISKKK